MKKDKLVLIFAFVLVLLIVSYVVLGIFTKGSRDVAMSKLKLPKSLELYEALVSESDSELSPELKIRVEETRESIELFDSMSEDIGEFGGDEEWVDLITQSSTEILNDSRLEPLISSHKNLLEKIRVLAKRGRPVRQIDMSEFPMLDLEHLGQLRACARLLYASALAASKNVNLEKAAEELATCIELSNALAEEPILTSQLVRIAVFSWAFDGYRDAIVPGTLPADKAQRLIDLASQSINRDAISDAVRNEIFFGVESMEQNTGNNILLRLLQPVRDWNTRVYVETWNTFAGAAELPSYEARPAFERIATDTENMSIVHYIPRTLTSLLMPAMTRAHEAQSRLEAQVGLMQLGITLEQHYGEHGSYPSNLDMISSDLDGGLPVDPFSGNSYIYRQQGGSFLLYSPGANLTDDGGIHDYRGGDIVWRGRKSEEEYED